ncbi:hypothetical protein C8Q77DRAFT_1070893 [Trametes polyzona]|nr:hypothetical protein C8Q77DRAFT_1070893 [Trametes polyzona]
MPSDLGHWKFLAGGAIATACLSVFLSTWVTTRKRKDTESRPISLSATPDGVKIRTKLPLDLPSWRLVKVKGKNDSEVWQDLNDFFLKRGYTPWVPMSISLMAIPFSTDIVSNGSGYAPLARGWGETTPMSAMYRFNYPHPSCQAAQTTDGRSVIIRVLAIGDEGREHVEILKLIARGPCSLVATNHTIPLLELIDFEDITFGVFPKIGAAVAQCYGAWPENSVADILDMVMQCLEALAFIHDLHIAHRDAFKDNFLVQWHPESLRVGAYPISRPRVYLNDFETAVRFAPDTPEEQRICVGLPLGPSFPYPERYRRPIPPEVDSQKPYNPFQLDVWQFSTSFQDFKSQIPEVDAVMDILRDPEASLRPSAGEAASHIAWTVSSILPQALHYPPEIRGRSSGKNANSPAVEVHTTIDADPPLSDAHDSGSLV